jgi:branched-chain amino acid transport system substrate-binding protein
VGGRGQDLRHCLVEQRATHHAIVEEQGFGLRTRVRRRTVTARRRRCGGPPAARAARVVALLVTALLAAVLAGCSSSANAPKSSATGVYPTRVVVGALVSQTGPLPALFAPVVTGARAYLDMVNAKGGVDGRKIDLAYTLDDQSSPSIDAGQARTLVDEYHVFAVVAVATASFAGGKFLAAQGVPTFGLHVNPQWMDGPSLYGNNGSFITFTSPNVQAAFIAQQHHVHAAAVLAYNVAQSQEGCSGMVNGLRRYHVPIAYEDLAIPAPASDLHADVTRMKQAKVDMVVSCMTLSGNVLLSQTMRATGMTGVTQLWATGYDENAILQHTASMQGAYFMEPNVPFEVTKLQPGVYPGMDQFQTMLKKYFPRTLPSETALAGWTSAALFVEGMRAVGRNLTRSRLVHAINTFKSFTAGTILAPVDWRTAHTSSGPINCNAFVRAEGKTFVPVYGTEKSVFSCFETPQPPATRPISVLDPVPAGVPPN